MSDGAHTLPRWAIAAPLLGLLTLVAAAIFGQGWFLLVVVAALFACVTAAVHHAEVVAHRVGEPFGTLLLAVAVTVIEVGLIVTLMIAGGPAAAGLARDTVFAAVMLILNGIVGGCLLLGGSRHREQEFGLFGVSASVVTLTAIAVLTMVLPNFTDSTPGPTYSGSQLAFIAVVSLVLYATFLRVQTVRHRDYFLPRNAAADEGAHAAPPSARTAAAAGALLCVSLTAVVLLAKTLAPSVERAVAAAGAPKAVVGILIAAITLLPESTAALRAAYQNRLQTSLNLGLGSALASIGLTVPTVAVVALVTGWPLELGLAAKDTTLLLLSLFLVTVSLGTGRTTIMQGAVHLVIFAAYLFLSVVP